MRMTLAQFKRLSGIPATKKEFAGYSFMCIHRMITENAEVGYKHDQITKGQRNQLLLWRDNVLDNMSF